MLYSDVFNSDIKNKELNTSISFSGANGNLLAGTMLGGTVNFVWVDHGYTGNLSIPSGLCPQRSDITVTDTNGNRTITLTTSGVVTKVLNKSGYYVDDRDLLIYKR